MPDLKCEDVANATIKIQKVVNIIFVIFCSSKKSRKSSLCGLILISNIYKKVKITIDCKKNLLIGDSSKPLSDNKPRIKIKIKNVLNKISPSFQKKIHPTKIIKLFPGLPPSKKLIWRVNSPKKQKIIWKIKVV